MTFIWPVMLIGLILIPVFIVAYFRLQQRRRALVAAFGNTAGSLRPTGARFAGLRRHLPSVFFLLALAILIVALARPQTTVSLPELEGTVILAFDVSGSMAGDDLKPTRMDAAKEAAKEFVAKQPSTVQIGVVSFSDAGFAVQIPTNDQDKVLAAINRLTPQKGTSLGQGINASLNAISAGNNEPITLANLPSKSPTPTPTPVPKGQYSSAVIVLLSDGENNMDPDPTQAAQNAADRGVRIYTIGVGSADGALLHLDGFTVRSRLDEATLQNISQLTGGAYSNASNEQELQNVYNNLNPELVIKPQKTEVTSIFAGVGILVLMLGGAMSLFWLGRLP